MKQRLKNILACFAVILCFFALLGLCSRLLSPKYCTDLVEGGMIGQYYHQSGNHDVIFIGDCEVYSNFSPMEMYRSHGITAYVRGSSQQLIWQSYYILKETLKYEKPKAVVYNVNAMRYSEPVSEAYNRLTIDTMRWSKEKLSIIQASMMEEESFWYYVFPILRYHSRFDELTAEDIEYLFKDKDNTHNGYLMNQNVKPAANLPAMRPLADYTFSDTCYDYLDKTMQLCKENHVELILIKAPSLYPYWYDEYDSQISQYAQKNGLHYYNFTQCNEEIGLDFSTDTYDAGLHLNLSGARKLSVYFAAILQENHNIPDQRENEEIAQLYAKKLKRYDEEIEKGRLDQHEKDDPASSGNYGYIDSLQSCTG